MTEQEYDKEQLRILRNAFKAFDHDERGYIEHNDVQAILEILGQKLDEKAIKVLIKEVDKGNSGKLDFSQFCRLAARFIEVEEDANALASELKEAFRVYDKEGKGYLPVQVLRDILHELDDKLSSNDLDMIIEEIDADGSGTVDFDEFMQVMTGKNIADFTLNRRFVFASNSLPACKNPACHCPSRRLRLHRRIEWHFERLFQQLCKPVVKKHESCCCSKTPAVCAAERKPVAASSAITAKTATSTNVCKSTASSSTTTTRIVAASATTSNRFCYRPIFRPRFPKWVPIFTLYREILQNPFRHRRHYMITHY